MPFYDYCAHCGRVAKQTVLTRYPHFCRQCKWFSEATRPRMEEEFFELRNWLRVIHSILDHPENL